jgi:hypothetical protein
MQSLARPPRAGRAELDTDGQYVAAPRPPTAQAGRASRYQSRRRRSRRCDRAPRSNPSSPFDGRPHAQSSTGAAALPLWSSIVLACQRSWHPQLRHRAALLIPLKQRHVVVRAPVPSRAPAIALKLLDVRDGVTMTLKDFERRRVGVPPLGFGRGIARQRRGSAIVGLGNVPIELQRAAALDGIEHCPFADGERMDGLVSWTVSSSDVRQLQPRLVALRRPQ